MQEDCPVPSRPTIWASYLGDPSTKTLAWTRGFGTLTVSDLTGSLSRVCVTSKAWIRFYPLASLLVDVAWYRAILRGRGTLAHASGLEEDGKVLVVSGWLGSGKTYVTLWLTLDRGMAMLSDDMIQVYPEGLISGYPVPLKISRRHLKDFKLRVGKLKRIRLGLAELLERVPMLRRRLEATIAIKPEDLGIRVSKGGIARLLVYVTKGAFEKLHEVDCELVVRRIALQNEYERDFWLSRIIIPYAIVDENFDLVKLRAEELRILGKAFNRATCFDVVYPNLSRLISLLERLYGTL